MVMQKVVDESADNSLLRIDFFAGCQKKKVLNKIETEMLFHQHTATYCRQKSHSFFPQQLYNQYVFSLLGDGKVWVAVRKILFILCPMLLVGHLLLVSICLDLEQSARKVDDVHHSLIETQIKLRFKRDKIFSADYVRMLAAEKLFLHVPDVNQISRL
jgi:hypothetical protein